MTYPGPSRRTLARGAAWALPTIAVAAAAPAVAASPSPQPCTPDGCPSGDLSTGWQSASASIIANTGTTGYKAIWAPATGHNGCANPGTGAGTANGVAVGEGDPSARGSYLLYSKTLCFARGTVIRPSFEYLTYAANGRAAYMQMFIEPFTGQTPGVALGIGGAPLSTQVVAPALSATLAVRGPRSHSQCRRPGDS